MIYCIVGPSGSGKSTVVEKLNQLGYKSPDSYTTRPKRTPDEKGHTFITKEEYDKLENKVATTCFNGYYYCVTKEMLEGCDYYIIDPAGVKTLKEHNVVCKVIGLDIPFEVCFERMCNRGDSEEKAEERVNHDKKAFNNFLNECDYIIDATKDIDTIVEEILKISKK